MLKETARFLTMEARVAVGVKQVIPIASPAAGSDWSAQVPAGEQWRILSGFATLLTTAVVGNRGIGLKYNIDGRDVLETTSGQAQPASTPRNHVWFQGAGMAFSGTLTVGIIAPIPMIWLPQGAIVGTVTNNIDVGDQWSAITLYVERYYVTDQQLEVVAEEHMRDYIASMNQPTGGT